MRKYLAPIAICLALGLGLAGAQTINKALQLSQDATGAFSIDSFNGAYFPGHILSPLTGTGVRPLPTVTGTGTPTITGTDTAGTVTMGTSATTATVVFGTAYGSVPVCVLTWATVLATESPVFTAASIAITQTSTSGNKINYICLSAS